MRRKWRRVTAGLSVAALVALSAMTIAQNHEGIATGPPEERLERVAERTTLSREDLASATLDPRVCPTYGLITSSVEPGAEVVIRTEEGTLIRLDTNEVAAAVAALQAQEESARHLGVAPENGVVDTTRLSTFLSLACDGSEDETPGDARPLVREPVAPEPAQERDPFGADLLEMDSDEFIGGGAF